MLKLLKEKMLVSLVVVMLVALVFGSISSLATTIKPSSSTNNTAAEDNTVGAAVNTNTNTNKASNTNKAINKNTNTNKAANTNKNVANKNTNTNKASKLPYAGSDSSLIFVVIALSASAVYAYKKVSDYNV